MLTPSFKALFLLLDYEFKNVELLRQALTHKSFSSESKTKLEFNEKLEFLGDAVLDLTLSEILYKTFPNDNEGALSKKRASLVNEEILAKLAIKCGISKFLLLGKGELQSGGAQKPRLLASAYEAVVGSLFLDGGYEASKKFISATFAEEISGLNLDIDFDKDFKTRLQEMVQKVHKLPPVYELIAQEGPAHDRIFKVGLKINSELISEGDGRTKKEAEQMAAKLAINVMQTRYRKKEVI